MKRRKIIFPAFGLTLLLCACLLSSADLFGRSDDKADKDSPVVTLTSSNYDKETSKGLVFVDFWAVWCGPCRRMAPILEEIAEEYKDVVKVGKLNVDNYKKLSLDKGIEVLPTIVVYKGGKEITRIRGLVSKETLVKVISENKD
ncbi:MAG: thioredoxin [Prevotella sp.]|jgi:thioredoxin 1|nr:thioredoxin [Prevotella sp.]